MSYQRVKRLSTFRRIALAMWAPPRDGTIYGTTQVDITKALAYVEKTEAETGVKVSLGVLAGRAVTSTKRHSSRSIRPLVPPNPILACRWTCIGKRTAQQRRKLVGPP